MNDSNRATNTSKSPLLKSQDKPIAWSEGTEDDEVDNRLATEKTVDGTVDTVRLQTDAHDSDRMTYLEVGEDELILRAAIFSNFV